VQILRNVKEEEIVANACKIVRICLREEGHCDATIKQYRDLGNTLVEVVKAHRYSDAIQMEVLAVRFRDQSRPFGTSPGRLTTWFCLWWSTWRLWLS